MHGDTQKQGVRVEMCAPGDQTESPVPVWHTSLKRQEQVWGFFFFLPKEN